MIAHAGSDVTAIEQVIVLRVRCDLGSLAEVNAAVRTTTKFGAQPLTGVVHAGGVLEDASLRNQTAAHVRHVFAPKLSAALGLAQVRAESVLICAHSMQCGEQDSIANVN